MNNLDVLLSRLLWPSALVRERAATAVSDLILNAGMPARSTAEALLKWMSVQTLESTGALGLVVLCRVAVHQRQNLPDRDEVTGVLRKPSLLSHLLLRELFGSEAATPDWQQLHSGVAPATFVARDFFQKFKKAFVPGIYTWSIETAERGTGLPLSHQWAYEWEQIVAGETYEPTDRVLDFGVRPHGPRMVVDFRLSEIYRSAFLRALAWAVTTGRLSEGSADFLAAEACPIDLARWQVVPGKAPEWWPTPAEPTGSIDTVPADVWNKVRILWERQQNLFGNDVLLAANGRVYEGGATYELAIRGAFQATRGSDRGDPAELFKGCDNANCSTTASGLRFEGEIKAEEPRALATYSADWLVVPASVWTPPTVSSRWQFWRGYVSPRLPAPYLAKDTFTFRCMRDGIQFFDGGHRVGMWSDWTHGVTEEIDETLSPRHGWMLTLSRDAIDSFATEHGLVFTWLCQLKGYHRQHSYEPYKEVADHQVFGATNVIRP